MTLASAQSPPKPPAAPAPAAAANVAPAPVPLADVPAQAEAVLNELRAIDASLAADGRLARAAESLPNLAHEIDERRDETGEALARNPSLARLRTLEEGWRVMRATLGAQRKELSGRVDAIDKQTARLAELEGQWNATLPLATRPDTPPAVRNRVQETLAALKAGRAALDKRRAETLALLDRVATFDARAAEGAGQVDAAKKRVLGSLAARQATPVWSPGALAVRSEDAEQSTAAQQLDAVVRYADENRASLAIHVAVAAVLAALLFAVRRRIVAWSEEVPSLVASRTIFDRPIAAAVVLASLASRQIYLEAPPLFWATVGGVTLAATVLVLRRVADRRLLPVLNATVAFFVVDQARTLAAPLVVSSRLLFLAEMLAGVLVALWLMRRAGRDDGRLDRWMRIGAQLALVAFAAAFAANAAGFTNLADLIGRSVLGSAYAGVILYAAVLIGDALLLLALHARPLTLLRMVRLHAEGIWTRLRRILRWLAVAVWLAIALDRLSLREAFANAAAAILGAGVRTGALDISVGDLLAFVAAIWSAVLVSRFARFVLEEDVFPRVSLPRGLPYAITTTLHYLILVIGVLAGIAALGVDMTKLTILVGAFTVGIGFGLQNIINNFVSGLILLFERPVKVGDVIQVGDSVGVVQRIGIRATVMRTAAGAEIILPNGKFISDQLTNWTRSTSYRPIEIPLTVAGGADPDEVTALLTRAASAQDGVLAAPAPEVLLTRIGPDALAFELRVWTDRADDWTRVRSDVLRSLNHALADAGIGLR